MFNVDDLLFEIPFFKVNKQKWNEKTRRMRNSGVEPSLIRHFRRKEGWWRHNSTIGYVYIFKHFDKLGAAYSKRDRKLDRRPYRGNFEFVSSLSIYEKVSSLDDLFKIIDKIKNHDAIKKYELDLSVVKNISSIIDWGSVSDNGLLDSGFHEKLNEDGLTEQDAGLLQKILDSGSSDKPSKADVIEVLKMLS